MSPYRCDVTTIERVQTTSIYQSSVAFQARMPQQPNCVPTMVNMICGPMMLPGPILLSVKKSPQSSGGWWPFPRDRQCLWTS